MREDEGKRGKRKRGKRGKREEGKDEGKKGKRGKKKKGTRMIKLFGCRDHKVSVTRSQTHFLITKNRRKRTKAPQTPRKHIKLLFRIWLFCIGWVGFFVLGGWALDSKP